MPNDTDGMQPAIGHRGFRSQEKFRRHLREHGWVIVADDSDPSRARHCRMIATKTVGVGEVRLLLSWERGRFVEGMIGRTGYASAYVIPTVAAARTVIADPGAGFVLNVQEAS